MTTANYIKTFFIAGLLGLSLLINAQEKYTAKNNLNFTISGTSTLHDWHMTSSEGSCATTFTIGSDRILQAVENVTFTMPAKSLKSGKGSMDKNAYKALKTDKFPSISGKLSSAEIISKGASTYTIKARINLTIAGKTIETPVIVTAKQLGNNEITVTGEKNISMKEFEMEPPSFMMGTVKTGNDVVVKFSFTLNATSTASN